MKATPPQERSESFTILDECLVVENRLWPAARLVFEASGYGAVGAWGGSYSSVTLDCPPNTQLETDLASAPAHVGVDCSYCDTPRSFDEPCRAWFSPDTYALQLEPEQATEIILQGYAFGHHGRGRMLGTIAPTETWVTPLEDWMQWQGYEAFEIPVRINAQGLAPGSYSAWVRTDSDCVSCARIDLTVGFAGDVPEHAEAPPSSSDAEIETSWGRLKELYR